MERSDIRIFEGKPFFVVMRRAETMEESCLRCHGDPAKAPADLVKVYGEDRSFHRKVGEAVSAISIRIPLSTAYAQADVSAWKLSGLLFLAMSLFLVASLWLNSRLVLSPLSLIRRKAQQIAESDVHLGEEIPVPSGRELGELTAAFNRMSIKLRKSRDDLENRVIERTAEMRMAIGNLAGGIAHDFNNLLGIIMGNCEMALLDTSVNTIVQQHLEQIARASRRAKNIVKQILAFSRKSDAGRTIVDIRWIIDETVGLLKFSTTQQIDIRWNARAKGVNTAILADPNQIQQALLNLCTNSIHAMRDRKGILEIGLDVVDLTESNTPAGLKAEPGSYVKIRVSDTGHGISDEILPRIFDPYFTTKERSEGTGLGLSVVEGIVKSHNGAIQVRSQPGSGTVLNIFLPRPQVPIPAQKGEKPVDPAKGHHSILIVDDEKELLAALKSMLEHLGYLVAAASGASQAMEIFRKKPETFDLVITDHDMPGTMGSELALQIARVRSDVPIILCTGHLGDALVDQLRDKGIRSVLLKPFSLRQLAAEVEKLLHGEKGE